MESPIEVNGNISTEQSKALSMPSSSSLIENMGLVSAEEKSLSSRLLNMQSNVQKALNEVSVITTHDSNLEKQYNETAAENVQLKAALYRARREITTLKGKLTLLQMIPSEIREQRRRQLAQTKNIQKQERRLKEKTKSQELLNACIRVPSFQERSRTVNCFGEYIDYSRRVERDRKRTTTYPIKHTISRPAATYVKAEPLPPSVSGCSCSVCNTEQSLGTFTLGQNYTRSRQQILQGDRVIIPGGNLGTVKYIGRVEFDGGEKVFIGIQLDAPVGVCDGQIKGKRYFSCPPNHGVFIRPKDIFSVIGRKSKSSGTSIPRIRQGPLVADTYGLTPTGTAPKTSGVTMTPQRTPDSLLQASELLTEEMKQLLTEQKTPSELLNPSAIEMSRRIIQLQNKVKHSTPPDADGNTTAAEEDGRQPSFSRHQSAQSRLSERQPSQPTEIQESTDYEQQSVQQLQETLMAELHNKDLGNTGYVTSIELSSALQTSLQLSKEQVDSLIAETGLDIVEGQGIRYTQDMVQQITDAAMKRK